MTDEKGATAAALLARAKVWFAAHGITHIHRVVTDNGACYRSGDFARIVGQRTRHRKTKPYTPRHNGKVERYQRILAEELLYAREFSSEDARSSAIAVWNTRITTTTTARTAALVDDRPHPDSATASPTSNPHTTSTLSGLAPVFIPRRWEAVTGVFGDARKRYERVGQRSDLRSVNQPNVEGLWWRDQFSNAFRPGIRTESRA